MELLKASDIRKSFEDCEGRLEILKGLNLVVNRGETVAITGESGSGKSTLLHILGLLDQADKGQVLYQGKEIKSSGRQSEIFRNQRLGFIFQFHYLLEDFTALENVAIPRYYMLGKKQEAEEKARNLLSMLNLESRLDHYPNQLSGGEQQRVAVARALINDPDLVFADEPTGNLDQKHSESLVEVLLEMNRKHAQSFVLVTHDQTIAQKMHRHYILEDGVLREPR